MIAGRCGDASRGLLEFYVNGSLAPDETDSVRVHLQSCTVCSRETDELREIAVAVKVHGVGASAAAGPLRDHGRWRAWAIAASLLLPVIGGLVWLVARSAGEPQRIVQAPTAPLVVDLGSGPIREGGGVTISLTELHARSGPVVFDLVVPVRAGSRYSAEVRNPDGRVLVQPAPVPPPDAYGHVRFEVPADRIEEPGEYEVVVQREDSTGEPRAYRYPFRVEPPAGGEQRESN